MDAIVDLSWRVYPALALVAFGMTLALYGIRGLLLALSLANSNHSEMQNFMRGFRIAVIGVTMLGLGASWNWQILWLFVLVLVFGAEELLESTTHLYIISRSPA